MEVKQKISEIISKSPEFVISFALIALGIMAAGLAISTPKSEFPNVDKKIDDTSFVIKDRKIDNKIDLNVESKIEDKFFRNRAIELSKELSFFKKNKFENFSDVISLSRNRLLEETDRLVSVSNKNLSIGIIFSLIAFSLMTYVTYNSEKFELYGVIYRISLVVLVQFVGFFFLRLYVGNELDIKQNKNEITNLELKAIACYLSEKNDFKSCFFNYRIFCTRRKKCCSKNRR